MTDRWKNLRIGLMGVGLEAYWPQFEGLEERLRGYLQVVERQIENPHRAVVNFGLVDHYSKSSETGHAGREQDIDVLLI